MNIYMKFIDLFCGIGSFHHSFAKLGWDCVHACDINENARNTYKLNYDIKPEKDIIDVDKDKIPDHDILCAGFPCQPFSNIGQKKGFTDERGTLIYQVIEILKKKKPKCFVLENVRGLLNSNNGKDFEKIVKLLEKENYNVYHKVLKCSDFNLPQNRQRLFIVGVKKYIKKKFKFPVPQKLTITLSQLLGKKFKKDISNTIRCGGRHSGLGNKHNWDAYQLTNGETYTLTYNDCLLLQGFSKDFIFDCSETAKYKMLGNTIPTNLTYNIGLSIRNVLREPEPDPKTNISVKKSIIKSNNKAVNKQQRETANVKLEEKLKIKQKDTKQVIKVKPITKTKSKIKEI